MAYSFLNDLKDIQTYQVHSEVFLRIAPVIYNGLSPAGNTATVQQVNNSSIVNKKFLNRLIPIMLCSIWENFTNDVKIADNPRYKKHFETQWYLVWHNDEIREVAFLRNCIVHNNSKVGDTYNKYARIKKHGFKLGDEIVFTDKDLSTMYEDFENAYASVLK